MKIRHFVFSGLMAGLAAQATASQAFAMGEQEAAARSKAAYQLLQGAKFEEAAAAYSEIIADPALPPEIQRNALMSRAFAEQRMGKSKDSVADYSAALAVAGITADLRAVALYNRGLSYHQAKDLVHSVEDYTAALMVKPDLSQAYFARGQVLRENGQLIFALSDFERALKYGHPQPARVHFISALTQEQLQRTIEARREYAAALAIDPSLETAKQRLAMLGGAVAASAVEAKPPAAATSVEVVERALPKPVEPVAALLTAAQAPVAADPTPTASIAETSTSKKIYTDRIAPSEPVTDISPVAAASNEITGSTTPAPAIVESEPPGKPAAAASGWAVQLVSASTQAAAESGWKQMLAKFKVLQGYEPTIVKAELGKKGIVYRVRLLGYDKQADAAAVCKGLHAKGVPCYVSNTGS